MARLFLAIVFVAIHWLVVLPVALIVATPYFLVASIFSSLPYGRALIDYYKRLYSSFVRFWKEFGWYCSP